MPVGQTKACEDWAPKPARRRDLIPEGACSEMRRELEAIAKMTSGLIARLDKRKS